jgi:hypothetical protein
MPAIGREFRQPCRTGQTVTTGLVSVPISVLARIALWKLALRNIVLMGAVGN